MKDEETTLVLERLFRPTHPCHVLSRPTDAAAIEQIDQHVKVQFICLFSSLLSFSLSKHFIRKKKSMVCVIIVISVVSFLFWWHRRGKDWNLVVGCAERAAVWFERVSNKEDSIGIFSLKKNLERKTHTHTDTLGRYIYMIMMITSRIFMCRLGAFYF